MRLMKWRVYLPKPTARYEPAHIDQWVNQVESLCDSTSLSHGSPSRGFQRLYPPLSSRIATPQHYSTGLRAVGFAHFLSTPSSLIETSESPARSAGIPLVGGLSEPATSRLLGEMATFQRGAIRSLATFLRYALLESVNKDS